MGYRTDQFYNLQNAGESGYGTRTLPRGGPDGGTTYYDSSGDNGSFMYPARDVRTNDHNGYKNTQLRRGYIRSLRTQADGVAVDVKKCVFQFNPSVLEQSVVQAEGLLNVFQSDPSQYAQPIPGNVSFGFTLFFDRTMEVNNPTKGSSGTIDPTNPWELSDASEVGVLKDLAALYAAIGQGISSHQNDYLEALLTRTATLENNANIGTDGTGTGDTDFEGKINSIPDFLQMNTGNVGFLLPVPVRAVFSSLYIVEGFVASTSVNFTKFSTQMVPLQASVTVNMDAKYVGFAQKDTFLSYSLQQEYDLYSEAQKQAVEDKNDLANAGAEAMRSVRVGVYSTGKTETPLTLYQMLFSPPFNPSVQNTQSEFLFRAKPGASQSSITEKFNGGTISGGFVTGGVEVYGPLSAPPSNTSQVALQSFVVTGGASLVAMRGMAGGPPGVTNQNSSTAAEWEKTALGATGESTATPILPVDDSATKYYIVKYRAKVTLKGDGKQANGEGEYYVIVPPGSDSYTLDNTINLAWPTFGQNSDGTAVQVTNTIDRTAPRSSSDVGSRPIQGRS